MSDLVGNPEDRFSCNVVHVTGHKDNCFAGMDKETAEKEYIALVERLKQTYQ